MLWTCFVLLVLNGLVLLLCGLFVIMLWARPLLLTCRVAITAAAVYSVLSLVRFGLCTDHMWAIIISDITAFLAVDLYALWLTQLVKAAFGRRFVDTSLTALLQGMLLVTAVCVLLFVGPVVALRMTLADIDQTTRIISWLSVGLYLLLSCLGWLVICRLFRTQDHASPRHKRFKCFHDRGYFCTTHQRTLMLLVVWTCTTLLGALASSLKLPDDTFFVKLGEVVGVFSLALFEGVGGVYQQLMVLSMPTPAQVSSKVRSLSTRRVPLECPRLHAISGTAASRPNSLTHPSTPVLASLSVNSDLRRKGPPHGVGPSPCSQHSIMVAQPVKIHTGSGRTRVQQRRMSPPSFSKGSDTSSTFKHSRSLSRSSRDFKNQKDPDRPYSRSTRRMSLSLKVLEAVGPLVLTKGMRDTVGHRQQSVCATSMGNSDFLESSWNHKRVSSISGRKLKVAKHLKREDSHSEDASHQHPHGRSASRSIELAQFGVPPRSPLLRCAPGFSPRTQRAKSAQGLNRSDRCVRVTELAELQSPPPLSPLQETRGPRRLRGQAVIREDTLVAQVPLRRPFAVPPPVTLPQTTFTLDRQLNLTGDDSDYVTSLYSVLTPCSTASPSNHPAKGNSPGPASHHSSRCSRSSSSGTSFSTGRATTGTHPSDTDSCSLRVSDTCTPSYTDHSVEYMSASRGVVLKAGEEEDDERRAFGVARALRTPTPQESVSLPPE